MTDEQLARQLDAQINGHSRQSRTRAAAPKSRSASSSKAKLKSKNGKPGAKVKSQKYVYDSDDPNAGPSDFGSDTEEDDEDAVEDEDASDGAPKRKSAKTSKSDAPKKKRSGNSGSAFNKTWQLSEQLALVTGETELSRPQVVKQIWVYIKEHDLQDPKDKRKIICDDNLQAVFGSKRVNMFSMNVGRLLCRV